MSLFLGIDTSNYTTSTALFDSETGELRQCKRLLPVKEGQLGLRQSDAVFHHTAQLHELFSELVRDADTTQIAAVGASVRPRPVDGSYMPCFTVGENTAKVLSSALRIPLYGFSHPDPAVRLFSSGGSRRCRAVQREQARAFRARFYRLSCQRRHHRGCAGSRRERRLLT